MTLQGTFSTWEQSQESLSQENKNLRGSDVVVPNDISEVMGVAQSIADTINAAQVPYQARSSNSNAFANSAYQALTGKVPPDQDQAIGSGTPLPPLPKLKPPCQ